MPLVAAKGGFEALPSAISGMITGSSNPPARKPPVPTRIDRRQQQPPGEEAPRPDATRIVKGACDECRIAAGLLDAGQPSQCAGRGKLPSAIEDRTRVRGKRAADDDEGDDKGRDDASHTSSFRCGPLTES